MINPLPVLMSSVWLQPAHTRNLWITMLLLADANGVVEAAKPAIASIANVGDYRLSDAAFAWLLSADKDNEHCEGRARIATVPGGFKILDFEKYSDGISGVPSPTREQRGHIYFITSGDAVKIGFSVNPVSRLDALQTGSPHKLVLLGSYPGSMADEKNLHGMFSKFRLEGEWFAFRDELKTWVADNLRTDLPASSPPLPSPA